MPAVHAWRPALVAADVVVGDHGSVTLYGAAIGKPVLLAAFGEDAVPGTAIHQLAAVAPRLDPRGDLLGQIENAVRAHAPDRYAHVAQRAFADPGQALGRLRAALYHLLKLPEPSSPAPRPPSPPAAAPPATPVTSWRVSSALGGDEAQPIVVVRRFPAAVRADGETYTDPPLSFVHLACSDDERDTRLTESASAVLAPHSAPTTTGALRWIRDALARLPGSLLAATAVEGGGCLVGIRDGRVVEAAATGLGREPGLAAAVVYTLLRTDRPLGDAWVTLRIAGAGDEDVVLRERPVQTGSP
jgi:hypothetical protein